MSWPTTALLRQSCVSHHWRCAHQQSPVTYFQPAEPLQRRESPITNRVFGSARPRRRILREHQFNTPRITALSGETTSFLTPSAKGSLKQNWGNRSFTRLPVLGNVARVTLWGDSRLGAKWWRFAAFFGGWMTRSHHLAGEVHANCLRRTYCDRSLPLVELPRELLLLALCRWTLGSERHRSVFA